MNLLDITLYFGIAAVAGAINSVAGGGTFLTFPVLILNGLTPLQANIMSTIALWPGTLASAHGYRGVLAFDRKRFLPYVLIGLIGGTIGATLLLATPEQVFADLVPWLLLVATLIFTFGRQVIALLDKYFPTRGERRWGSYLFQLMIGIYGGYFGAGIGILTLAMLQLLGWTHIHQMNAIKTLLAGAVNAMTFLVFVFSGQVVWAVAAIMIPGGLFGGYVGAKLALKVSPEKIRLLVIMIGFAMTIYFFMHEA